MAQDSQRSIELERTAKGSYRAANVRGGTISVGSGSDDDFTPVELLLTAIAACSAIDVDFITAKRAEPTTFTARASGDKIADTDQSGNGGNRMINLALDFDIAFPDDEGGRRAVEVLERSIKQSHDRLCTVGRTIEAASPIAATLRGNPVA